MGILNVSVVCAGLLGGKKQQTSFSVFFFFFLLQSECIMLTPFKYGEEIIYQNFILQNVCQYYEKRKVCTFSNFFLILCFF